MGDASVTALEAALRRRVAGEVRFDDGSRGLYAAGSRAPSTHVRTDPSTHNHCTLGGMIGNNSCGVQSVMAGMTADNVEALEVLTYAGDRFRVSKAGAQLLFERDGPRVAKSAY